MQDEVRTFIEVCDALLLEASAEEDQVTCYHGVHHHYQHQRHDQRQEGINNVDKPHRFMITFSEVTHAVTVDSGGDETVAV